MSYMLEPGSRLGSYEIKRILGVGGFGVTYHAIDMQLNRDVAIKEYFPGIAFRDKDSYAVKAKSHSHQQEYDIGLNRFYKEAQIIAQFNHINVVRILNVFEGNGTAYIVMEYEHGEDLHHYLERIRRPLGYGEIIGFFMPVLDGLRAVHKKNVLHLDIKPDNIFIRTNSTPCLIDFGGARHYAAQESRMVVAKVSFMVAADGFSPPEQYNSASSDKGPWSDIYALGATIYACMNNGKSPTPSLERSGDLMNERADPLQPAAIKFKGKYPQDLLELVDRCLSPQRARRPQNAQEMQDILIKIANNESIKWQESAPKPKAAPQPAHQHGFVAPPPVSPPPYQAQGIYSGAAGPAPLSPDNFVYAGFWLRLAALLLDTILIVVVLFVVGFIYGIAGGDVEAMASTSETFGPVDIINIILQWLYFAGMESSASGNTFGKRAVGIRVVDLQGQRISFGKATGRYFGKILSALIVLIGYFMAGFTARKQALHDMMAGTLVIKKA
ncbi:MAG: protein kinase [Gammaproteobacteria bacterium]|nr:protein kinase [Gammaproteobacteria bacterium]MBU1724972.1 protein kinase [Gammaproteobacteria bacterium]MBU2006034.1 protein kinase [Gammaproteobacteria bacterium]